MTKRKTFKADKIAWVDIPTCTDERGVLSAIEQLSDIPFSIKRVFYLYNIKSNRGNHALKNTDELLVALAGSFSIRLFDGKKTKTFHLNSPSRGLYIPRCVYLEMFDFTEDAVCLVLASKLYDSREYLRTKEEFLNYLNRKKCR